MTPDEIREQISIISVCERDGMVFKRKGREMVALCPFHEDRNPSFRVSVEKGVWMCDPCDCGGSVIDYVAKKKGISIKEAIEDLGGTKNAPGCPPVRPKLAKIYSYTNELGEEVYQAIRTEPKGFRQRHRVEGKWVWNMDGVQRVLYNLPEVMKAKEVWECEGEKDVDALTKLGLVATCNVGGAGKWMDAYSEVLRGKDVILIPDNDEAGKRHVAQIMESLVGKVASTRRIILPGVPDKGDVSDFIAAHPKDAKDLLLDLAAKVPKLINGIDIPILSMEEMEHKYVEFQKHSESSVLDLGKWLPSLGKYVRGLVPGEVVTILSETGTGKTSVLQNIALAISPMKSLLFELELPESLTFERFMAMQHNITGEAVWNMYKGGNDMALGACKSVYTCSLSKLTPEGIEKLIIQSELKIGERPRVVLIDYIGLVQGKGMGRYERTASVAEELKIIAKSTGTIIIAASQVNRNKDREEIGLHDAKGAGEIENSSGLCLGMWRDTTTDSILNIKILKNTKGRKGMKIRCTISSTLRIFEVEREEKKNIDRTPD